MSKLINNGEGGVCWGGEGGGSGQLDLARFGLGHARVGQFMITKMYFNNVDY